MGTHSFAKSSFLLSRALHNSCDKIRFDRLALCREFCSSVCISSSFFFFFAILLAPLVSSVQSLKMGFVDNRIHQYQYSLILKCQFEVAVKLSQVYQVYQEPYPIASLNEVLVELNEANIIVLNHVLNQIYQKI